LNQFRAKQVLSFHQRDISKRQSDFVRRSIRKELASLSFLSESQKKALGMKNE
jgi:hypothetical protein